MSENSLKNQLFYGDNLDVLGRYVADESIDLVYLDPPFNSNANYNVLFAERDGTQAAAQCFPERDLKNYASRVSCSSCGTESPSNGTRRLFRAADFASLFGSIRVSQRYFGAFRGFAWVI